MEKILVEEFEILKNGNQYAISFQLDDGMITDADFVYDGRNCAILTRNKSKAYLFTNIVPDMRKVLSEANDIVIFEENGKEVANAYKVDIRHVAEIPYPDNFEKDLSAMLEELKGELGEEEFTELMKNIAKEYGKK